MIKKSNVVVDIGNSKIKSALFENGHLISKFTSNDLKGIYDHYATVDGKWIFSSVGNYREEILQLFGHFAPLLLTHQTALPIKLAYETPETLGVDRIAGVIGGSVLVRKPPILVIDAGTCITYDLVDEMGVFQGGSISPGLSMRMKAMAHFTLKLPDISLEWQEIKTTLTGKTTKACIRNGAVEGCLAEIEGLIERYSKDYPGLVVMLTGGDCIYFESRLKASIFADLNLVLIGLNRILTYNQ